MVRVSVLMPIAQDLPQFFSSMSSIGNFLSTVFPDRVHASGELVKGMVFFVSDIVRMAGGIWSRVHERGQRMVKSTSGALYGSVSQTLCALYLSCGTISNMHSSISSGNLLNGRALSSNRDSLCVCFSKYSAQERKTHSSEVKPAKDGQCWKLGNFTVGPPRGEGASCG